MFWVSLLENREIEDKRFCNNCKSTKTRIRGTWEEWRYNNGLRYCINCYARLFVSKEKKSEQNKKRLWFNGKCIRVKNKIKLGICERCKKKIGDKFIDFFGKEQIIRKTDMHHWFYLIIMPWACTEELCVSCHSKIRWRK